MSNLDFDVDFGGSHLDNLTNSVLRRSDWCYFCSKLHFVDCGAVLAAGAVVEVGNHHGEGVCCILNPSVQLLRTLQSCGICRILLICVALLVPVDKLSR